MIRVESHAGIADELQSWSDEDLLRLLNDPQIQEIGYGTVAFRCGGVNVFVKLVPLSNFEMQLQNYQSTANVFQLPTYYQYRIGSCGFGAWREIKAHLLANMWVISRQCTQFPLLHHWRVLPIVHTNYDDRINIRLWENCEAIHRRIASITEATHSVVMFLEHCPYTLNQWLREQLLHCSDPIAIVEKLESSLTEILSFINSQGFIHMDAHFDNILTDGKQLFLADYGLVLSNKFQLDSGERQFFDEHQNFDTCTALNSLVYTIVNHYNSREDWRQALQELTDADHGSVEAVPVTICSYLKRRVPLVMRLGAFYHQLMENLTTPYPASDLQEILNDL
ncbi:MAG: hypothetical protein AAGD25_07395 [Cyanobacteria bacterium P01_F01_bin.150]